MHPTPTTFKNCKDIEHSIRSHSTSWNIKCSCHILDSTENSSVQPTANESLPHNSQNRICYLASTSLNYVHRLGGWLKVRRDLHTPPPPCQGGPHRSSCCLPSAFECLQSLSNLCQCLVNLTVQKSASWCSNRASCVLFSAFCVSILPQPYCNSPPKDAQHTVGPSLWWRHIACSGPPELLTETLLQKYFQLVSP